MDFCSPTWCKKSTRCHLRGVTIQPLVHLRGVRSLRGSTVHLRGVRLHLAPTWCQKPTWQHCAPTWCSLHIFPIYVYKNNISKYNINLNILGGLRVLSHPVQDQVREGRNGQSSRPHKQQQQL